MGLNTGLSIYYYEIGGKLLISVNLNICDNREDYNKFQTWCE